MRHSRNGKGCAGSVGLFINSSGQRIAGTLAHTHTHTHSLVATSCCNLQLQQGEEGGAAPQTRLEFIFVCCISFHLLVCFAPNGTFIWASRRQGGGAWHLCCSCAPPLDLWPKRALLECFVARKAAAGPLQHFLPTPLDCSCSREGWGGGESEQW